RWGIGWVEVAGAVPPLRLADLPEVCVLDAKRSYSQLGRSRWRNPNFHPEKSKRDTSAISELERSPKASPAAPRCTPCKTSRRAFHPKPAAHPARRPRDGECASAPHRSRPKHAGLQKPAAAIKEPSHASGKGDPSHQWGKPICCAWSFYHLIAFLLKLIF